MSESHLRLSLRVPRSRAEPEGKRDITSTKDKATLRLANTITRNTLNVAAEYWKQGVLVTLENPAGSLLWKTKAFTKFTKLTSPKMITMDYCQYGEHFRKRTKLCVASKHGLPRGSMT